MDLETERYGSKQGNMDLETGRCGSKLGDMYLENREIWI